MLALCFNIMVLLMPRIIIEDQNLYTHVTAEITGGTRVVYNNNNTIHYDFAEVC